jgi:hypothetical protein
MRFKKTPQFDNCVGQGVVEMPKMLWQFTLVLKMSQPLDLPAHVLNSDSPEVSSRSFKCMRLSLEARQIVIDKGQPHAFHPLGRVDFEEVDELFQQALLAADFELQELSQFRLIQLGRFHFVSPASVSFCFEEGKKKMKPV